MTSAQFPTLRTTQRDIAFDDALIARFGKAMAPEVGEAVSSKALALLAASTRTRSDDRTTY